MRKPDFFIIGGPKCGTTSLAQYLSEHQYIFMSPFKDRHFFNTDERNVATLSLSDYNAAFSGASERHLAVGDAAVWYLFSDRAVANILDYVHDPRFIVMIRNPLDMAYSLHQQQLFGGDEDIQDFEEAWRLQAQRAEGRGLSSQCIEPRHLMYGPACLLGGQIERLYRIAGKDAVWITVFDDMKHDTRKEYCRVLEFLGVPNDDRASFPIVNQAKARRSLFVRRGVRIGGEIKKRLRIKKGLGVLRAIDDANSIFWPRACMPRHLQAELKSYFREDVEKLSDLIGRSLTRWVL